MQSIKKHQKYDSIDLNRWKIKKWRDGHLSLSKQIIYRGNTWNVILKTVTPETESRFGGYIEFKLGDGKIPVEPITGVKLWRFDESEWIQFESEVPTDELEYLIKYTNNVLNQIGAHDDDCLYIMRKHPAPTLTQSLIETLNATLVWVSLPRQSIYVSKGFIVGDTYYDTIDKPGVKIIRDHTKLIKEVLYQDNLEDEDIDFWESILTITYEDGTHDVTIW